MLDELEEGLSVLRQDRGEGAQTPAVETQPYLVLYNYGQGGVWAYVLAGSKAQIEERFPELTVVDEVPSWMSEEFRATLEQNAEDLDSFGPGLLADIRARRAH